MNTRTKAELFLLSCTIIWGGTFVAVKNVLVDSPPLLLLAFRFAVATLLILPFVWKRMKTINAVSLRGGLVIGTFLFLGFAAQSIGLQYTTASKSGFITGLLVIFTPIFQILIERRAPKLGNVAGILLVTAGLYLLTSPDGSSFNIGDGLTLLCAASFGLYIVYLDVYSKKGDVWQLVLIQFVFTAASATVGTLVFETLSFNMTANFVGGLAYLAILATLYTLSIQVRYQKDTTPTRAAVIFAVEPVFAALFAYVFLSETIGVGGVLGGALVMCGLLVSELSDVLFKRRSTAPVSRS